MAGIQSGHLDVLEAVRKEVGLTLLDHAREDGPPLPVAAPVGFQEGFGQKSDRKAAALVVRALESDREILAEKLVLVVEVVEHAESGACEKRADRLGHRSIGSAERNRDVELVRLADQVLATSAPLVHRHVCGFEVGGKRVGRLKTKTSCPRHRVRRGNRPSPSLDDRIEGRHQLMGQQRLDSLHWRIAMAPCEVQQRTPDRGVPKRLP
jgi:hypothetical protein